MPSFHTEEKAKVQFFISLNICDHI